MRKSEKFANLKKGDVVVVYYPDNHREHPIEANITSIGRKYITVVDKWGWESKYTKEHGYGDYGKYIFPGSMEEFEEDKRLKEYRLEVQKSFETAIRDLTRDELDTIMNIINR